MLAMILACALTAGEDAKTDLAKMQGSWSVVSGESDGAAESARLNSVTTFTFQDDQLSIKILGRSFARASLTLDPAKKLKELNAKNTEGAAKGYTLKGVYELEGDNLKICWGMKGGPRPTGFTTSAGSGRRLWVLKREKSAN
jgi:uncharacterized protein (TIGR03067 family)